MEIASNFKIASSVPETFSGEAKKQFGGRFDIQKMSIALIGLVIVAVVYYYRSTLLNIYNTGIMNYIWSMIYLTSRGEVATTQVPETSVANSLFK